jgi:hypothetical protein
VDDYPYFRRSGGHDHAILFGLDNGPFCGGGHVSPLNKHVAPILELLQNVSVISNNGFHGENDWRTHFEEEARGRSAGDNGKKTIQCYREGLDITVPQAHGFVKPRDQLSSRDIGVADVERKNNENTENNGNNRVRSNDYTNIMNTTSRTSSSSSSSNKETASMTSEKIGSKENQRRLLLGTYVHTHVVAHTLHTPHILLTLQPSRRRRHSQQ